MMKMQKQNGFTLVEVFIALFVMPVIPIVIGLYADNKQDREHDRQEIQASDYQALDQMAKTRCAGTKHLKTVVSAGPVTYETYPILLGELDDMAKLQAAARAKASIANEKVETDCAVLPNQK